MTKEEALEKLELDIDASVDEIQSQFEEFSKELEMRVSNAPTDHQKALYRKKLSELEEAFSVLNTEP